MADARAWLEIDLAAIVANAHALALRAAPARLCAVVKSNAYGHGLVPVSQALAAAGIEGLRLAVFSADEAFALREAGVRLPIFVVGPVSDHDLPKASQSGLELALFDESDVARFAGLVLPVHVKIDTGTHRFGIVPSDAARVLKRCAESGLDVLGLYSHLANAEDLDRKFSFEQLAALSKVAQECFGERMPELHIAASAAAMLWPETRLDMVRCGIALYGAWPSPDVRAAMAGDAPSFALKPALRWFAPIAQVREVKAGESVGYGRAFKPKRDCLIATLPLGYADGLPRGAGGGKAQVRVGSALAPIAGRISMNACMVDVTDVKPAPLLGSTVELEIEDIAKAAGTINYEVLARLPQHLPRHYR